MKKIYAIGLVIIMLFGCSEILLEEDITNYHIYLNAPSDNAQLDFEAVSFNWQIIEDVDTYHLQVATPSFIAANKIVLDTVLVNNKYDLDLLPNSYEWRVCGINSAYTTKYTTFKFEVITAISNSTVQLIQPENNLITTISEQVLKWEPVSGATNYVVQIWQPDMNGTLIDEIELIDTTTAYSFNKGNFTWQVKALNKFSATNYSSHAITIE